MRGDSRSPRLGRRPDGRERVRSRHPARAGRAGGVAGVTALVEVESRGAVAVITLRREEKLNALSSKVERELAEALRDEPVRGSACVIVTGGARAFSAGADVNEMRDLDPASILAYYRETGGVYEDVASLPQPTIASIAGHCLGGGLELALACDFRVADATASFGFPEVGIGIVPSSQAVIASLDGDGG